MVDEVVLEQAFLLLFRFYPAMPPVLDICLYLNTNFNGRTSGRRLGSIEQRNAASDIGGTFRTKAGPA
jgi:hypothetical protein